MVLKQERRVNAASVAKRQSLSAAAAQKKLEVEEAAREVALQKAWAVGADERSRRRQDEENQREMRKAEQQAKKDEEDRILAKIVEETERKRKEEEEFNDLRDMLWAEELEAAQQSLTRALSDINTFRAQALNAETEQ